LKDAGIKVLWVAILAVALALTFQVGRAITDKKSPVVAEPAPGELTVRAALVASPARPVAVRGYVFLRDRFPPELCTGRIPGKPPRCLGPTITLFGLDVTRLEMKSGRDHGVGLQWTERPVALYGDLSTASLKVREILA
jgi:hypothetical protein